DFFTNGRRVVLEVRMAQPLLYQKVVDQLIKIPQVALFNADINLAQCYFYERGTYPLALCELEADKAGRVKSWKVLDSPWDLDYELPPLRYARLGYDLMQWRKGSGLVATRPDPFLHCGGRKIELAKGRFVLSLAKDAGAGTTYVMEASEEDLIRSLNRHIADWDPDILLTDGGDSYLLPRLAFHARRSGVALALGRGQVRRGGLDPFSRRLHIDTQNSFTVGHTDLDGLFEVARVAKIPLQRAARCTIGTALSSIQHEWAIRNDFLIPIDKGQTEDFRSADELIASDRGGLVYEPEIGWHEDLIEFDFESMYPEIMIRHNVSPEAVNCACCPDNKVPEIGHHLCRQKGMMPAVLGPLVEKRRQYKKLITVGHPNSASFKRRREAFKWMLVTSFGYLGFRNARFGKIEAHECVNAFSREALLRAKEVAEARGFHFVHAIVDSLWLKKPGVMAEEIETLRLKIEEATGLPLGFEGRYRWIRFCPSRTNERVGVPNRYYGAFTTGETKARGIELRRHDAPLFIKRLQEELLRVMAQARNVKELSVLRAAIEGIIDDYRDRLKAGKFSPAELAIHTRLTRKPSAYVHDTLSALAAKKLAASGVRLHPGDMIAYVVAEEHDKVKDWRVTPLALIEDAFEYDLKFYGRLLDRAIDITPFFPLSSVHHR
ncbi:MAG: hypothetical protein LHV69_11005, partial [Elusimicrobia bacterium]|nr:hypothetical protein [Candidatus Obscuribacterium magneticum]